MCGNKFWLPNAKCYALVFPLLTPEAGAGNKRIALFARVFYQRVVARPHIWIIATHLPTQIIYHTDIERLILFVAKDQATELGYVFCILWGGPTLNKSLTQLTTIVWGGGCYCCHCCCSSMFYAGILWKDSVIFRILCDGVIVES